MARRPCQVETPLHFGAMNAPASLRPSLRFGDFEFAPGLRRLERGGVAVELSSRSLDILSVLTERPGEVIPKQELLTRVWPHATVVEGALRVYMVALRRALGDQQDGRKFITTVPGQGYCFVGEIESSLAEGEADVVAAKAQAQARAVPRLLPPCPTNVVGRDAVVEDLQRQLELERFVTLVGPGGIGKTTVALLGAHNWVAAHGGAAVFVDLSEIGPGGGEGVPEAVCAKLGLAPQGLNPTETAIAHLQSNPALIVLDTCEGVIDSAARFAGSVVGSAPGVRVLATSREALRAEGEVVSRIGPLAAPAARLNLTAQEALKYPAVQLFVQRATASDLGFEFGDQQADVVGAICRELDGMALAIELAARRVEAFGLQQVAGQLATEFALTWPGRRTATPRQQTLRATLNWSHNLLTPMEQIVFRRLSVFVGSFTLERALALLSPTLTPSAALESLSSLVARALIHTDAGQTPFRYRLLDVTRAFAELKLAESDDDHTLRRGHALLYQSVLAEREAEPLSLPDELSANLRAALSWAFGPHGDGQLGVAIASAASPLWHEQGLLFENQTWAHRALGVLDAEPDNEATLRKRMALMSALLIYDGITEDVHRRLRAACDSAERLGLQDIQLNAVITLWGHNLRIGRYGAAEAFAKQHDALTHAFDSGGGPAPAPLMLGICAHYRGRQVEASVLLERIVKETTEEARAINLSRYGYDNEVGALRYLSNALFLAGRGREAARVSEEAIAKAAQRPNIWSLHDTLAWRVFNAFYARDGDEVDRRTDEIIKEGSRLGMANAVGVARTFRGLWHCDSGDWAQGEAMVRQGMAELAATHNFVLHPLLEAELHLRRVRRARDLSMIEPVGVPWREADPETWVTPEIRRIEGELAMLAGDFPRARLLFDEAEAMATRQGAARWRLRAALSAAELELRCERPRAAAECVAPALRAFAAAEVDGDLQRARQLVASTTSVNAAG
jgi:predicted ATPase/DNA-binding winged helix-turn-helix (wHTH) protein